jgi:hypothetical protein
MRLLRPRPRALAVAAIVAAAAPTALPRLAAQPTGTLPPSPGLLRSLEAFDRDLLLLDGALRGTAAQPQAVDASDGPQPALQAPAPQARPSLRSEDPPERVRLSLVQAVAVAVANNPELAEQRARIQQRQGVVRAVEGRFWPRLGLSVGGAFSQASVYNKVLEGNLGLYPVDSPFLVETDSWNRIQANLGMASPAWIWAGS